ncbi:MAG: flagellar export protein FliJ [Treponema sp.]|nr:flagellar export protein FliJ [Treponema sp.]
MKKFSFELEDVLEVRHFEEEAAQGELAKALAVETQIQNDLNTIASQYAATKAGMKGSLNSADYIAASQYYKLLDYQKEELLKKMAEANIVTEEKRKILLGIMQNVQALEKMKEEELRKYNIEVQKEEDNEADEINSIRFNNR